MTIQYLLACILMGIAAAACGGTAVGQSPSTIDNDVITVRSATVRFAVQTRIPATRGGRIQAIGVTTNQAVQANDAILQLDDRALRLAQQAAKLRLAAAQRTAASTVHQDYAQMALAESEAEWDASRSVQQEAPGAIAANQMRRLRLAVERAKLQVDDASEQRHQSQTEADILAAELARIEADIDDATVRSVTGGVVIDLAYAAGEWVTAGDTVAIVARADRLRVDALVDASRLRQNDCVGAAVMAMWIDPATGVDHEIGGVIESTDLQQLPGNRYRVHAIVDNRPGVDGATWLLKPGTEVTLRIVADENVARAFRSPDAINDGSFHRIKR